MKIPIKKTVPTSFSLDPKHKPEYKTIEREVEIRDELLPKYIALIDELRDRTWDEMENRSWTTAVVPLVPFPFFEKYREPENTDGDYWVSFWLTTSLRDNIFERAEIIYALRELEGIDSIEKDPVIDLKKGMLNGTAFTVSIDRDALSLLRKTFLHGYEKLQKQERSQTIDVSKLNFSEALYLLRAVYNKVFEILDAVCRGPVMMADTRLNFSYTILLQAVEDILKMKGFEELKTEMPQLFDSLVGDLSEADSEWEFGFGPAARNFFAKIEKFYILKGAETHDLPKSAHRVLAEADEALQQYRKQVQGHWNRVLKNIDEQKQRGDFGFEKQPQVTVPETFTVSVKDREIWINDFLLSKPYATKPNKEFFDYLYENAGKSITRGDIPEYASVALRGGKSIVKALTELGFKGEILKAFFPERSKTKVQFVNNVSASDLEKRGIKLPLLMQELSTAHTKNNPK